MTPILSLPISFAMVLLGACHSDTDPPAATGPALEAAISGLATERAAASAGKRTEPSVSIPDGTASDKSHPDRSKSEKSDQHATQVFFGDTHHHTANSGDAFLHGDRLGPEEAYQFALGKEISSSSGVKMKLVTPLDFLVISDHAEGLGVIHEVFQGNPAYMKDETLQRWRRAMQQGGQEAAKVGNEVVSAQAQGTLPQALKDPETSGPVIKSVWRAYTAAAEKYNAPGSFTAMIGFEWTSVPGGNNLHRNVLFRNDKQIADKIVVPFSAWQSEDPAKLWEWMARIEEKTGAKLLAIPHNGNLSNGRMFELQTFTGESLTKEYAQQRTRWERLQEVMQTKGASETHPTLSPNDEFAEFGIAGWDNGNLTLEGQPESPQMRPHMYLRGGLLQGLKQEQKLGANPFKFGFIGGTDVHNSLTAIEEQNFGGKHVDQEPRPERWKDVQKQGFGKTRYTWQYTAAGLAAIWAQENTREALWDALYRRESYATSGTRITVRFFAGWDFVTADRTGDIAQIGYKKGVPMGSDLPVRRHHRSPTFLVSAMKDPRWGNLDRIQIIKGWLDKGGDVREKIYNVAWSEPDTRKLDASGRLPAVGNTVDSDNATWENIIGAKSLTTVWEDPEFDPKLPAFYYARVLEIPTPRWTAFDQKRFGIKMDSNVVMQHQERAWTSPVWYSPN